MTQESYEAIIEQLFLDLEDCFLSAEPEVDCDLEEGNLLVYLPEGSQLVLSRQPALQELWLASPLGAYHFRQHQGKWETRQGESLSDILTNIFQHYGIQVSL